MIIGLTGTHCGGKDTAANYLVKKNFIHHSLSDIIREEARKKGIKLTRENLIKLGNELRKEFGASVLAKKILTKLDKDKNCVISSIRNPSEVEALRKNSNFILINIDAPIGVRLERMKRKTTEKNPKTLEELKRIEDIENSSNPMHQQIKKCQKLADIKIINNSTLQNLYKEIDQLFLNSGNQIPNS